MDELEELLAVAPGVRTAVAAARDGQVVGWVVATDDVQFSMTEVYDHVVQRARPDALPHFLLLVDRIPRRPDGSLDHHGLIWP